MLSDTEINIAIAQACGIHGPWVEEVTPCACRGNWALYNPAGVRLPDYCNDLDEMWGAIELISGLELPVFIRELVIQTGNVHWNAARVLGPIDVSNLMRLKARQIAVPWLKAKGLWHDR